MWQRFCAAACIRLTCPLLTKCLPLAATLRALQVVANVTAAELARRLEKEGVVVVSFFAGAAGHNPLCIYDGCDRCPSLLRCSSSSFAISARSLLPATPCRLRVRLPCATQPAERRCARSARPGHRRAGAWVGEQRRHAGSQGSPRLARAAELPLPLLMCKAMTCSVTPAFRQLPVACFLGGPDQRQGGGGCEGPVLD